MATNGRLRFTPDQCCQFCGGGDLFKNYLYTEGRCLHYDNTTNLLPLKISAIEEAHTLHVHRSSCCWFCGYSPDQYVYTKNESASHCKFDGLEDGLPDAKCIICETVVVTVKELIESEKDAIKHQIMSLCDQTVVLRRWCTQMVDNHLDSIITFIEVKIHLSEICFRYLKACPAPDNFTLTAPVRSTILDPNTDGDPLLPEELFDLPEITHTNLDHYIKMENLSPEDKLYNLRFLARYQLIYNSNRCKVCGVGASLIKQADLLDGFVWRCAECKAQKISSKTVVRAGSFFYNMKKPVGLILLTAATFIGDPTLTLEQIIETIVIERPTLIAYQNYFLDVVQLVVTGRSGNLVGGASKIVDVETTILYTDKYSTTINNRRFTHCIVFIERGSANYVVAEVAKFDTASLADATARHVRDGTKLSSSDYPSIGGVNAVQLEFDSRHPTLNSKFHEFDTVAVRSTEASKWNAIKTTYEEASKKYPQRASLTLTYVLTRTSVKKFNSFLYGLTLYNPDDASL